MKSFIKLIIVNLILISSLVVCPVAFANSDTQAEINELLEKMIIYYGNYEEQAEPLVKSILEEISGMDKQQGQLWTSIMDYWKYANNELVVNTDELPQDLPEDDSLCLVILGYELNPDGTMQEELEGRLKVALACAGQYPDAYVLCTGGGTAAYYPEITEAGLMGEWLLEQGLSEDRLIVEDKSKTTAENAKFSYEILLNSFPQVKSVALITSSYHVPWGSLLFEAAFLRTASENGTPPLDLVSNCSYETVNEKYKVSELLRWETGGMLQFIGDDDLALEYYLDSFEKPALPDVKD